MPNKNKKKKKSTNNGDAAQKAISAATKGFGPGQREKFMKDPLYGKGAGAGMITQGKSSFTENLSTRIKKKLSGILKMKKGGSLSQYD